MGFRLDIPDIHDAMGWALKDLAKLMNPYTAGDFFRGLGKREGMNLYVIFLWALLSLMSCVFISDWMILLPALLVALLIALWYGNYTSRLLLLLGLSVFLGYALHFVFFSYPVHAIITSMKLGYVYWMSYVFVTITTAIVLRLKGDRLVGRVVTNDEATSLTLYFMVPALITGIFRLFLETTIIHYIALAYSIYVFYLGIKIMFGFSRAMYVFLALVLTAAITGMLLLVLSTMFLGIPTPYY